MRPRTAALTILPCLLLLALVLAAQQPPAAPAAPPDPQQPPNVTIELNRGGQMRKMKLAIPAFRGPGQLAGAAGQAGKELEETVRRDLEQSGYFEIQGPDALSGLALTGDVQQDLTAYRSTGNEVLLLGDVRGEGDRLVFEGRVLDARQRPGGARQALPGAFPGEPPHRPHLRRRGDPLSHRQAGDRPLQHRLRLGPHRQQRDLRHGLRRSEPAADHRPPLHLHVAGVEPGRRRPRLHLVLQRSAGHLPGRPGERPQEADRRLGLAQHQPQLLAGRPSHRLRPLARRQHRDLHRRHRRRRPAAADQLERHRHQPGLEPQGGRDRLHLQPRRQSHICT